MRKDEFESSFCLALVEEILYRRDRNPEKDWWHIWGLTTIYSYSRWNLSMYSIPVPKEFLDSPIKFTSCKIELYQGDFSEEVNMFLRKYNVFEHWDTVNIDWEDAYIFPKLYKILQWYQTNYIRASLAEIWEDYLLAFLYGISKEETWKHDYYFCFCESIDTLWIESLIHSWKRNPNYLFSNIAIASYFFQEKKMDISEKYFLQALRLDSDNPWVLWKYAILLSTLSDSDSQKLSEALLKKVTTLLPDAPWVYDWYGEILYRSGRYTEALAEFEKYEHITEGKYRTFEPYMKRAEVYLALWDILSARECLDLEKEYYFWEWYRERLETLKSNVSAFAQRLNLR